MPIDEGLANEFPIKTPNNIRATNNLQDKIIITWDTISDAVGYQVFYNTINDYADIKPSYTISSYFEHLDASAGVAYYYWVKANGSKGDSDYSYVAIGALTQAAPIDPPPVKEIEPIPIEVSQPLKTDEFIALALKDLDNFSGVVGEKRLLKTNEVGDKFYVITVRFIKDNIVRYHDINFVTLNEGTVEERSYFKDLRPTKSILG